MKRVATQLGDAVVLLNSVRARLQDVACLSGARNPEASLREVKQAIADTNHLQAILDDLRSRYVGACLAQDRARQSKSKLEVVSK